MNSAFILWFLTTLSGMVLGGVLVDESAPWVWFLAFGYCGFTLYMNLVYVGKR